MVSSLLVFFHPFFSQGSYLSDLGKEVSIENGFAIDSVKHFDISIYIGLPAWII
jgi:hypothetical protein